MGYSILTKIDRELLRLDPELAPRRQLKDLVWARSSIRSVKEDLGPKKLGVLVSFLLTFKDLVRALLVATEKMALIEPQRPQLPPPKEKLKEGSYRPPRYFSKGSLEKKKAAPIPYLLIETNEISKARPVPGNSLFLRSLAKGKGTLEKNDEGLFYLDIDNRFILSLLPYLKAFGLVKAPYFNLTPDGAHIPVIPPREAEFHYIDKIEEEGKEFTFEIEGLYSLEPTLWPEVEQVWFFKVRSPELEALRQRQLLISKPGGHSFHIAIAIKPRQTKMRQPLPLPVMRINVAFLAA
jgi:hypothetical protein